MNSEQRYRASLAARARIARRQSHGPRLGIGSPIGPRGATVCPVYCGPRVCGYTRSPSGLIPTAQALAWADAHRMHRCRYYDECLEAAASAESRGDLGAGLTWCCDSCTAYEEEEP